MDLGDGRPAAARRLAAAARERGDAVGWFEELYSTAARGQVVVPWAEFRPNPHLRSWAANRAVDGTGKRALVVGCGLGDDAEFLAELGFRVTAFDVSDTAVAGAKARFPGSPVEYTAADVLSPPVAWRAGYDLVVEAYTVQVYQGDLRSVVIRQVISMVASGGTLLVIAHARADDDPPGLMPWPLTRSEVAGFATAGLVLAGIDWLYDDAPPGPRWRAEFHASS